MLLRRCLWNVVALAALWPLGAAAQEGTAGAKPAWPRPAPAQKNVLTRVLFPERPGIELDDSPETLKRLLKELDADDGATALRAFNALFWIGEPARRALAPLVKRATADPAAATRRDARAYKALHAIDRFAFYRAIATPLKLEAPVVTATPQRLTGTRWPHGVIGKPEAVSLEVNTDRQVSYGLNYRGMQLLIVNRSGATIEVGRAGMRIDCIAEAETKDGWVAIEAPPTQDRRRPKVWKLKPGFGAESAVPLYAGTLHTRLRYRLALRGRAEPVYSNIFPATINPAQLTGVPGRLAHDHTPR